MLGRSVYVLLRHFDFHLGEGTEQMARMVLTLELCAQESLKGGSHPGSKARQDVCSDFGGENI